MLGYSDPLTGTTSFRKQTGLWLDMTRVCTITSKQAGVACSVVGKSGIWRVPGGADDHPAGPDPVME